MNEILLRCQTSGAKAVFQADGATLCSLTLGESSNKNNHRQAEELDVVVAVSDNALATIHHPTSCPYVGIIGRVANR